MIKLHLLSSDAEQEIDFLEGLKDRMVPQKLMYRGESAKEYCEVWALRDSENYIVEEELREVLEKYSDKDKKMAIISVGCGDAYHESRVLSRLEERGYDFVYYGVDSSRDMLDIAAQNFKDVDYEANLIFADFMSHIFASEILKLTEHCDDAAFFFLGSTLGNLSQPGAIDSLYNLMHKGEKLFIEVGIRPSLSKEDDIKIFKRARDRLSDQKFMDIYFQQLKDAGVPYKSGTIVLDTSLEDAIGAMKLTYSFLVQEKTKITIRGEVLHLLPQEKIKVQDIRMYEKSKLIKFLTDHEFIFLEQQIKERQGLFVFKK